MSLTNRVFTPAARRFFNQYMGSVSWGRLDVHLPGGECLTREGSEPGQHAAMHVKRWRTFAKVMRRGDIGFAESYIAGDWETPDLTALMTVLAKNVDQFNDKFSAKGWDRWTTALQHAMRQNTLRQSRKNIEAHYDLGNTFYQLWLDPSMTYSSALFHDEKQSLEQAQQAKYQRMLEQAELEPNSHLLEVGCGWGGFAAAAAEAGHRVTGITISPSQLAFAQERLAAEIKAGSVSLELTDYREISGSFDAVVSIEMFEAVGREWWSTYMETLRGRVKPGARAVVQTITINDELFDSYVEQPDFIQTCIFPGSLLSCPSQFKDHARAAGLEAEGDHFFGLSYAETLRRWQQAFNAEEDSVRDLGFDTEFIRLWNFYMSYCIGGFEAERTNVAQFAFRAA